jgi:hypothetical protein
MLHEVVRSQCVDGADVLLVDNLIDKAPNEQLVLFTGHLAISSHGADTPPDATVPLLQRPNESV